MSQHSTHETWVIAYRESHSPAIHLAADEIFTTRSEADQELERANEAFRTHPLRLGAAESGYRVLSLDEFLAEQRAASVEEARVQAFNGECRR